MWLLRGELSTAVHKPLISLISVSLHSLPLSSPKAATTERAKRNPSPFLVAETAVFSPLSPLFSRSPLQGGDGRQGETKPFSVSWSRDRGRRIRFFDWSIPSAMGDYNDPFNRNNPAVQARTKAQNRANVLQLKLVICKNPRRFPFTAFFPLSLSIFALLVVSLLSD